MHTLGRRNIEEMGMILKRMPLTSGSTVVAAMSIAGAPPPIFWGEAIMIIAASSGNTVEMCFARTAI